MSLSDQGTRNGDLGENEMEPDISPLELVDVAERPAILLQGAFKPGEVVSSGPLRRQPDQSRFQEQVELVKMLLPERRAQAQPGWRGLSR